MCRNLRSGTTSSNVLISVTGLWDCGHCFSCRALGGIHSSCPAERDEVQSCLSCCVGGESLTDTVGTSRYWPTELRWLLGQYTGLFRSNPNCCVGMKDNLPPGTSNKQRSHFTSLDLSTVNLHEWNSCYQIWKRAVNLLCRRYGNYIECELRSCQDKELSRLMQKCFDLVQNQIKNLDPVNLNVVSHWWRCANCEVFVVYTRSSPQTQGGVWKLTTGRKAAISNQRMNNSSSVTRSPDREPPVGRERQMR